MNLFRSPLIALSEARSLRSFAENSPLARRISRRFVAGLHIEDVVEVARQLNALGISVTFDALGENVDSVAAAHAAGRIYHELIDKIDQLKLDANVSLKLTQMGMDLGQGIAEFIVDELTQHAAARNTFVRVDMEGSRYTQATLDLVRRIHAAPGYGKSVGVVVQAYLHRTRADVELLLSEGIRMRLCKGAYLEPSSISFASKEATDRNYVELAKLMLRSGIFHGLATHDKAILEEIKGFVAEERISREGFEFQMLYGIRRDLQESLVKQGYRMRVYIPFGTEWYPYFMRRLAERPANVFFIAKNMFR